MVRLRYVYRSRARSSSSPEWSATAIPLSTPQLDFHQRDLYSTFRTPFTLLSTLHAFMVGYCLLKFNLGGFASRWLLQSCFRSRISRNIIFEKYRFPLHSRFSRDEKLYSFFLSSSNAIPFSKSRMSWEFLPLYLQFEMAEKSLRFITTFVIIELGFVRSCYVVTSGTKRATSYSRKYATFYRR